MGKIVVDMSICKGCGYCVQFCPAHAIRVGDKRNTSGYGNHCAEPVEGAKCVGCAVCAIVCPDTAITVYKE